MLRTYPNGQDVEIFKASTLSKAYKNAKTFYEKEHVTPYIWDNPRKFSIKNYWPTYIKKTLHNRYRLTLDYLDDFLLISKVFNKLYFSDRKFSFLKILKYLKNNPDDVKINKKLIKVNWYGLYLSKLKSIKKKDTKII